MTQEESAQTDAGWGSLFRNGLGIYTVMLNLGIGLHAVDVFIVSTVMPSVVRDIGGAEFYTWSTMLYMVASIVGAATGGPMKAWLGARHAYALGGLLFLAGSVGCALSPTMAVLLVARTVQGFGGGLITAMSMSLIGELFPSGLRKRVLAVVSSTWGIAALIGPAVGGIFAELGSWRGAFWINAPVIVAFLLAIWFRLPEQGKASSPRLFPYRRMALLTVGVLSVGGASHLPNPPLQAGLIAVAVLLVWATLKLDHAGAAKLFPTRPFALSSAVGVGYWVMFLSSMTHTVIGAFLPLALQVLRGVEPLMAGYMTASLAVCWTLASVATAHLHGRAASIAIMTGQVMCCAGLAALAFGIETVPTALVPALNGLVGLGLGSSNLHVVAATMRHAPSGEESITASSIPTIRSLGIAFGAAGAGVVANSAGLTDALLAPDVARSVLWVLGIGTMAPLAALLLSSRFIVLIHRDAARPEPS